MLDKGGQQSSNTMVGDGCKERERCYDLLIIDTNPIVEHIHRAILMTEATVVWVPHFEMGDQSHV